MHESFLRHQHWFYLKLATALSAAAILVYAWHDPPYGANGGTWLGYTLGVIGAGLIVWLAWLGVRKRRYRSNLGTLRGWTSAHVYFGLALLVIATLHTGFQFGWNIHTLAYVLMVLVIVSGVYGIVVYARYPRAITENRAQATRDAWLAEILDLNESAVELADTINPEMHRVTVRSVANMRIGGGVRAQLLGAARPGDGDEVAAIGDFLRQKLGASAEVRSAEAEQMILFTTVSIFVGETDPGIERLKRLLDLLSRRNELVMRLNRDIQAHARLQIWLYFHVPLTLALLAALVAHIVTVFLYW